MDCPFLRLEGKSSEKGAKKVTPVEGRSSTPGGTWVQVKGTLREGKMRHTVLNEVKRGKSAQQLTCEGASEWGLGGTKRREKRPGFSFTSRQKKTERGPRSPKRNNLNIRVEQSIGPPPKFN